MADAHGDGHAGVNAGGRGAGDAVRVFISYAHGDREHENRVRDLWLFLRQNGVDARLDLVAAEQRINWAEWMTREVRDADYVLVAASAGYKRRAGGDAEPDEGRGVQWEARLIEDLFYQDQKAGLRRFVPVVLPGSTEDDIPLWLAPAVATYYRVTECTVAGAEALLRLLTGQPGVVMPPLGTVPDLPPHDTPTASAVERGRPVLHTEVVIEAALPAGGELESAVWVAGSLLSHRRVMLPPEVRAVWEALRLPALVAADRVAEAGRRLAAALLAGAEQEVLGSVLNQVAAGDSAEVVLSGSGAALSLPLELVRLRAGGGEVGPLGLLAGVSVARRPAAPGRNVGALPSPPSPPSPPGTGGPLKVLAAVAAPEETKTDNAPLDTEAEMAAVLDAVTGVAADAGAQVRILEVASLPQIRQALATGAYHVLHLSAHGSPGTVELEDEDGGPVEVTTAELMQALKHAGRTVPLIMLASCSGGAAGTQAMAAGLLGQGADRVIAMLAPVTDDYATTLARYFYRELASRPGATVGQALAQARYLAEEERSRAGRDRLPVPEYGVATLLAAGGDGPLVDPAAGKVPLPVVTTPPGGKLVRDLPIGALIGRRTQMRDTMATLRRIPAAVERFGAASGVVLTGVGGIGKTAVAGRVMSRLRDDGWLVAVHEGPWNPAALITGVARALEEAAARAGGPAGAEALRAGAAWLADPGHDDGPKLAAIAGLLKSHQLLLVFDDFEQNLTAGGDAFADPAVDEVITGLADAAETGGLLVTCRYPLPGPDRFLAQIPLPPLSDAELRRLFLRLPALRDLDAEDRRLLMRTIGGHPRLIEFTDALLRGGRASLRHVQAKLRDLAREQKIDLARDQPLERVLDQAMLLGSADILLTELLRLLTPSQAQVLHQVAVCRAPMSLDDLAFTVTPAAGDDGGPVPGNEPDLTALRADVDRLTDLTLLTAGEGIVMHPWTAALVTGNTDADLRPQHERALAMRYRRFRQDHGTYEDLLDIPRHLSALGRYDDIADLAGQATRILPGTLATVACLAEIRPLIPPTERAWAIVAELEAMALLSAGDMPAATRQLRAMHQQIQVRAAADPANTGWQRDLSVSHSKLGDVAVAAGDLAAARAAYQAGLDIAARLAAADPANTAMAAGPVGQPQPAGGCGGGGRGPGRCPHRLPGQPGHPYPAGRRRPRQQPMAAGPVGQPRTAGGCGGGGRGPGRRPHRLPSRPGHSHPAGRRRPRQHRMAAGPVGQPQQAGGCGGGGRGPGRRPGRLPGGPGHRRAAGRRRPRQHRNGSGTCLSATNELGDVAVAAGDLAAARTAYQASLDIAARLAAADPANTEWQRDLSVSHNRLGDVARAAGDLAAARTAYQASLDIRTRLAAADPANSRMAAGPVGQPRTAGGCGEGGRGPGRRPHRLPGRPGHSHPAGRRRPRQHRMAAGPVDQPRTAGGCGGGGRGPGRRPGRLPGRPGHRRAAGRRRPRQHRNGSGTCLSATKSWGMWRWRPGTWLPSATPTRPAWTSVPGWPPPTPPTPNGSGIWRQYGRKSTTSPTDYGSSVDAVRIGVSGTGGIRQRLGPAVRAGQAVKLSRPLDDQAPGPVRVLPFGIPRAPYVRGRHCRHAGLADAP